MRTYLRVSLIVCAFDTLAYLVRTAAYTYVKFYSSPLEAAGAAMYHLMSSYNPGGGLQGLENRTIPRLLLLFIGALPQALKLIGVRGILWTKTWEILFLVHLLVMECARILEKR